MQTQPVVLSATLEDASVPKAGCDDPVEQYITVGEDLMRRSSSLCSEDFDMCVQPTR